MNREGSFKVIISSTFQYVVEGMVWESAQTRVVVVWVVLNSTSVSHSKGS